MRLTASWRQESTACQCVYTILSVHLLVYYTGILSPTPVQEDLLNGDEDEEFIRKLAANIATPTLIAWGDHDQVRAVKLCVYVPLDSLHGQPPSSLLFLPCPFLIHLSFFPTRSSLPPHPSLSLLFQTLPTISTFLSFFLPAHPSSHQICHPSGAALLKDLIDNSEVVMLPKCGHAVTMDRPRKCAQVLRNFIGKHAVTMETTAQ